MTFEIHHRVRTASTNLDARAGRPGDVFTADEQTAGRGRLDHRWLSPPGVNLMMSVVLDVSDVPVERSVTLPLVAGLAVAEAMTRWTDRKGASLEPELKWPNDVLCAGRKLAGILCERVDGRVIVGIGVNVRQTEFDPEIAMRATSLALLTGVDLSADCVLSVRDAVLARLAARYEQWRSGGFGALHADYARRDCLRGKTIAVLQTDSDASPTRGLCGGVSPDGTLRVGDVDVFAGEVHVATKIGIDSPRKMK